MNLAKVAGAVGLELINRMFSGASFTIYSGTQPTTPETALASNTALATFSFTTNPFGVPAFASGLMTAIGNLTAASQAPSASGTASFARATLTATAWTATHATAYGAIVSSSGFFFLATGSGTTGSTAPSPTGGVNGSGEGILDGSVTWLCIGSSTGQGNVLADYTCGTTTGFDVQLGSTTITTGVPVNISSFGQSLPTV